VAKKILQQEERRISQPGLWSQPNRESSKKEFQPLINTDAHGFVKIEFLSVRIRVYQWFLIFWRKFAQETKLSDVSSTDGHE